jgi:hypothetical protein
MALPAGPVEAELPPPAVGLALPLVPAGIDPEDGPFGDDALEKVPLGDVAAGTDPLVEATEVDPGTPGTADAPGAGGGPEPGGSALALGTDPAPPAAGVEEAPAVDWPPAACAPSAAVLWVTT